MSGTLLALSWALLVAAAAYRRRPAPARVRVLGPVPPRGADAPGRASLGSLAERLGARVLQGRAGASNPLTCRRVGFALLAALAALVVLPVASVPAALLAWALPAVGARRGERRRLQALAAELPDVVDLLLLAVGGGLTVHLAVAAVGRRAPGALAGELRRATEEAELGRRLADALEEVPARAGEAVRPLVAALVASERYGAPLAQGLERLAYDVRRERRRQAEEAARRVPVKLLFPLVCCILPAFGLLTVAPLIASAVRSLRL